MTPQWNRNAKPPQAKKPATAAKPKTLKPGEQRPLNTLVASAKRITATTITGRTIKAEEWQDDAWQMFDLVGEQRFLATTLANRLSQARLYVGRMPEFMSNDPEEILAPEDDEASADHRADGAEDTAVHGDESKGEEAIPPEVLSNVLETLGGTPASRSQIINRLGINLFIAGEGWLTGIPRNLLPESAGGTLDAEDEDEFVGPREYDPEDDELDELGSIGLDELEWRMLSLTEVKTVQGNKVQLSLDDDLQIVVDPSDVYLIRIWRPHPNKAWEADSPTRSSLGVLRELVGLSMHVGAQVDSRLAGAGILVVPQSATRALRIAAGMPEVPPEDGDDDPFTEALLEAMLTPISDRSNASAVVPLIVTVPDDVADKINHITFSTPLDEEARELREEAIRRLALGQDAPPELLLGTGGMNHWGAWLVQEDVVATHIEPTLALVCDALTTQYLWPVLEQMGYKAEDYKQYVIWYDVSHMIVRPNRASDAKGLYDAGVLSAEAYRRAAGFDEGDAPAAEIQAAKDEAEGRSDEDDALRQAAGMRAIDLAIANPQLVVEPGLKAVAEQVYEVMKGTFEASQKAEERSVEESTSEEDDTTGGTLPDTDGEDAEVPAFTIQGTQDSRALSS